MLKDFIEFTKEYGAALSLFTFLVGLIAGNWLSIGRDKRVEFNNLTDDIFVKLTRQIENKGIGGCEVDIIRIAPYMPIYKRWLFIHHARKYSAAINPANIYDPATTTVNHDPVKLKHLFTCTKNLLHYLRRR